jgi:threonine dehydratase
VVAKFECQQVTGSFKPRGAIAALGGLPSDARVITASAGNHGLAVAWAATQFGLRADVVLPYNASPLKRERILGLGAGVIEAGGTLEEATEEAKLLADRSGLHFVSPFNDPLVIAGQATVFLELLEQRSDLEALVVPVGGGGLLAGAVAACAELRSPLSIIGVEPLAFRSLGASMDAGEVTRVRRHPTYADGLATNLEPGSITLTIAEEAPALRFVSVTEEEVAAGCLALFNRESTLVEGAGAVGVSVALRADELGLPDGPIATVLTGSNVHHGLFWQMAAHVPDDPMLVAVTDTMGRLVGDEPIRRRNGVTEEDKVARVVDDAEVMVPASMHSAIQQYSVHTAQMLDDFSSLVAEEALPVEPGLIDFVVKLNDLVKVETGHPLPDSVAHREQRLRALSQLALATRMAFEWRAPGYEQAHAASIFDLGALGSPAVNYARYEQPGVAEIERQLADVLEVTPETHAVLLASSGMAAFALASATIMSVDRVRSVLTSPYIYFEADEMLRYVLRDAVHMVSTYDAEAIAVEARECSADVVFADPLANHPAQRMVDIPKLAEALSQQGDDRWLVVDASMLPATCSSGVLDALPRRAIYYESCSKYLQFGLDMTMAGLVVVPREYEALARRVRRNLGLGLDRFGTELFPSYRRTEFEQRMGVMERTALEVASVLRSFDDLGGFETTFPGLAHHPDHELALRYGRTGTCVTLVAPHTLSRDQLDPVVDTTIRYARDAGVPLVKGVSFGFNTTRVSAAAAMAEGAPPFLRIAVGALEPHLRAPLADSLRAAIQTAQRTWNVCSPDPDNFDRPVE